MSYAIRNDGLGWRAVNGPDDLGPDEYFSATVPEPLAPLAVTEITAVQGLKAIDHFGLSAEYELWVNDPARTFLQRTFINREPIWRRDDATLNAATTHLGLTSVQVDAMFEWADAP